MDNEAFYKEKRQYVRYELNATGEIKLPDGRKYSGVFGDISVAGAFFEAENIAKDAVDEMVNMGMLVEISGEMKAMVAQCKIVRVTDTGVGMLFGKMDESSKTTFNALLQNLREKLISD